MANIPFKSLLCFMQKRFLKTSATVVSTSPSSSFTIQYLMNSCGLPLETALSTSKKLQLNENNLQRHESVLNFFKSHGFTDTHIAKLITKRPIILQSKVNNNLRPKMQYLIDNGFSGSLLPELIVSNPFILGRSLTSNIKPSLDFLKMYLDTNEKIVAAVLRSSWLLSCTRTGIKQQNINLLISEGVPINSISKLIMLQPRVILEKADKLNLALKTSKKLGLKPTAPVFVHAIRVMVSMSESTWNRKIEVFRSLGWSEEDIKATFKSAPQCLSCSEEKIKAMMDFFVNTMKLDPAGIIAYPKLLMYGMDTRIRPRYNVLKVLESKKLLKENKKLVWALILGEKVFLKNYVMKHLDQLPHLMELYRGTVPTSNIGLS